MNGQIYQCFVFFHINYNDRTLWSAVFIHSTKYKYSRAERCIMISLHCYFDFYNFYNISIILIFHINQAILLESQLFQKGKHKIAHCTTYCTSVLIKCSKIITSAYKYTFFLFNKHNFYKHAQNTVCTHLHGLLPWEKLVTAQPAKALKKYFLKVI